MTGTESISGEVISHFGGRLKWWQEEALARLKECPIKIKMALQSQSCGGCLERRSASKLNQDLPS